MKIIPHRGSWFEIEIEKKGIINVKIDKKTKNPDYSDFLRAFGISNLMLIYLVLSREKMSGLLVILHQQFEKDKTKNRMDALYAIYKLLRPGDLGTDERVEQLFQSTFYDPKKFDLGAVARIKIESQTLSSLRRITVVLVDSPDAEKFLIAHRFPLQESSTSSLPL
jgi:DNA-directed RNA polymerase subunit beta